MAGKETLRERKKRETREQIQRAARKLMVESGYEKATMRSLAEAAGVGLGTISLHFKDKKTLLLSTFHDEIGRESLRAFESVPQVGTLKDKFMNIVAALYGYYGEHSIFLRPVVREAVFATGEWKMRFDAQLHEMIWMKIAMPAAGGLVVGLVERHKELGEVRPDVSGHHVAMAGWSLYLSGLIDGLNAETFDVDMQLARLEPLLDVLFDGVLVKGGNNV